MKKLVIGLALLAGVLRGLAAAIQPTGDAAKDTAAIQNAINAGGDVELGEGTFLINATLDVKNGVTVQGQGWEKTVIKAASGASIRCVKVSGGSKLVGVTVTGGNSSSRGAGVLVAGGTVSWCCVSNNTSSAADAGGGFALAEGTVDHSIIAFNKLTGVGWGGGIGGKPLTGSVVIDTCLIYGNSNSGGSGGGVGFDSPAKSVLIRNCTITGNTCSKFNTGGVYIYNNSSADISMVNTIVAGNTLNGTENNLKIHSGYKSNFKNCFLGLADEASGCVESQSGDPKFVDAANNDYRLGKGSPAIGAGVTYEGIGVDLDKARFAATPSIGCYEGFSVPTVAENPVIAPAAGKFYPTLDVTLTCETEGAAIRYTLDGTEPTAESALYEGAITLTETTTVSARAFKDDLEASETVSATYTYKEPKKIGQPDFGAYNYAFEFAADGYAGTTELKDFPVAVRLAEDSPAGFSYADTDGSDIRFADEDGNELAHEIDTWNVAGESLIWVRLPKLTKDTTFVMYYNGTAYNPATPQAVWGAGYAGVWHMGEADGDCADSTGHQLAATPAGKTAANKRYTGADAPFGGARTVTTASAGKGYLLVPNYDSLALGDTFTMSGWVHATGVTDYPRIFSRKNSYADGNGWELELGANSTTAFSARGSGNTPTVSGTFAGTGIKNAWLHIAVVYDGGTATVYGNGVAIATGTVGKANPDNGQPLAINCNPSGADGCVYGEFDECRLLDGAAGADWVKAEHDQGSAGFLSASERAAVISTGVAMPKISPNECVFYPSIEVSIACATAGATIRYTTDGTDPTASSPAYEGPFVLEESTTVKARAYEATLGESVVASVTYTFEEPLPPEFGEVTVTPKATSAKFVGEIAALGNYGATACDVYLAYGTAEGALGEKALIAAGATDAFTYTVSGLDRETTYYYELSISNNSEFAMVATTSGSFTTLAEDPALEPVVGDPAATRQAIQEAVDGAAAETPVGTVLLGKGTFEIDAELTLGGGVTLVGQGWTNTVIRQAGSARVMTLDGGAKVEGVTLTGGKPYASWVSGGGALVNNGTISWCCISNNAATGGNNYGGGIRIYQGQIDHSVIANNKAGNPGTGFGAGICYARNGLSDPMGPVLIDSCLFSENVANADGGAVFNGGTYVHDNMLTIRNTTIAKNSAVGSGGGLVNKRQQLTLVNCILADNTANAAVNYLIEEGVAAKVAEQTQNCFFGNGSAAFGTDSVAAQQVDFKDAGNGDYHLKASSLASDAGAWYDGIADDLDGVARKSPKTAAGCYECTEVDHGVVKLNPIVVTTGTTNATLTGSIATLGEGTSATVTLNYGRNAESLTEELTVSGVVTDFAFDVTGLMHATHYFFAVTVENDVGRTASASGDFFTQYDPAIALKPTDDPAENVTMLNTAFASAATTQGTVTLGEGVFEINSQLIVDGGITVVGQGWDKTIVKQVATTATDSTRVMKVSGGSTVKHVTLTGGNVLANWSHGAGAQVEDGTISWCCITNNRSVGNNIYGGGVNIAKGTIDHCIVAFNQAGGSTSSGGGIGGYNSYATIVVDTCLVCSNSVPSGENKGHGGGICFGAGNPDVTIRNTTVVGNSTTGTGGGIDISTSKVKLVNDIVWGNEVTSEDGDADVGGTPAEGSFGNLVGVDPLFKDAANGDYRVGADSPAVAVGQWYKGIVEDLDGKKRGRKPVAGCYTVRQGLTVFIK